MLRKITIYLEDAEPLPEGIRGATSCEKLTEEKETYYMMINGVLPDEEQEKTFMHECRHIYRGDFMPGLNVQMIERQSH